MATARTGTSTRFGVCRDVRCDRARDCDISCEVLDRLSACLVLQVTQLLTLSLSSRFLRTICVLNLDPPVSFFAASFATSQSQPFFSASADFEVRCLRWFFPNPPTADAVAGTCDGAGAEVSVVPRSSSLLAWRGASLSCCRPLGPLAGLDASVSVFFLVRAPRPPVVNFSLLDLEALRGVTTVDSPRFFTVSTEATPLVLHRLRFVGRLDCGARGFTTWNT